MRTRRRRCEIAARPENRTSHRPPSIAMSGDLRVQVVEEELIVDHLHVPRDVTHRLRETDQGSCSRRRCARGRRDVSRADLGIDAAQAIDAQVDARRAARQRPATRLDY